MVKTLIFTNKKQNMDIFNSTKTLISSAEMLKTSIDDLFPINVDAMIGSVENLLQNAGSYIRSSEFPNIVWMYNGKKNNPLQMEIVIGEKEVEENDDCSKVEYIEI